MCTRMISTALGSLARITVVPFDGVYNLAIKGILLVLYACPWHILMCCLPHALAMLTHTLVRLYFAKVPETSLARHTNEILYTLVEYLCPPNNSSSCTAQSVVRTSCPVDTYEIPIMSLSK